MIHVVSAPHCLLRSVVFCATIAACGCANQNSIFRIADTDAGKAETILIDAKQRPITVNTVTDPNKPMTCLARSADALSQAAASGNLKIDQSSGAGGAAGFATSEQVTSIAFRTQVTEAQQEFLYYLCQLRSNSVLSDDDVSENLRHFQNTMLAMVAIDDLAGGARFKAASTGGTPTGATDQPNKPDPSDPKAAAVKAQQTAVDDSKNGVKAAASKVATTSKAVLAVTDPKALKKPTDDLLSALKTYDQKQKAYSSELAKLVTAVKATKGDGAKEPDDVTTDTSSAADSAKAVQAKYTEVANSIATLAKITDASKLAPAQKDAKTALADYQTAVGTYETSEDGLGKAILTWNTATGSAPKDPKTPSGQDPSADSGPSAAVANDVTVIVQTIVWQSFLTEQCQKALFVNFDKLDPSVRGYCLQHLQKADEIREWQLTHYAGMTAPPRSPPPLSAESIPVVSQPSPQPPPPLFSLKEKPVLEQAFEEAFKKMKADESKDTAVPQH
jgi:hypothetical protein